MPVFRGAGAYRRVSPEEKIMKKLVLALTAVVGLAGCIVYDSPERYGYGHDRYYRDHDGSRRYDRDGDGVPNRYDRRPGDPYRN